MSGLAWIFRGACGKHPEIDWFPPPSASDRELEAARGVCLACPVLEACGKAAAAIGETHGVRGGYNCANEQERETLYRLHNRAAVPARTCAQCGTVFRSTRRARRCPNCARGYVPAGPAQDHVDRLRAADWTLAQIADVSGVLYNTVAVIAARRGDSMRPEIASALLAIEVDQAPPAPMRQGA